MKRKALAAIAKKLREDSPTYLSILEQAVEEYAAKRAEDQTMPNSPRDYSITSTEEIKLVEVGSTTEEGSSSLLKKVAISLLETDISTGRLVKTTIRNRKLSRHIPEKVKS